MVVDNNHFIIERPLSSLDNVTATFRHTYLRLPVLLRLHFVPVENSTFDYKKERIL